jgi:hypothetical protein
MTTLFRHIFILIIVQNVYNPFSWQIAEILCQLKYKKFALVRLVETSLLLCRV